MKGFQLCTEKAALKLKGTVARSDFFAHLFKVIQDLIFFGSFSVHTKIIWRFWRRLCLNETSRLKSL
jgi:hypothetical protein